MPALLSLELNGVVYFDHAKLDVTQRPMTIISGFNKDSLVSNQTSNGAGKSLLWSAFPNLRYDATPLADGKNRGATKKAMLKDKASSIIVEILADDGVTYKVEQYSSKLVIYRNGVDMEIRRSQEQRAKLEDIFPITEEEFYSYVYLQSQRSLGFLVDRPAARLHYITSLYRLDVYDQLKAYFTKKLGEIKASQVEFEVITSQLVRTNQLLERLDWSKEAADELERASTYIKATRVELRDLQNDFEKMQGARTVQKQYREVTKRIKGIKIPLPYSEVQSGIDNIEAVQEYKHKLSRFKQQSEDLQARIDKINPATDTEDLLEKAEKRAAAISKELKVLERAQDKFEEAEHEYKSVAKKLKPLGKPKTLKKKALAKLESDVEHLRSVITLAERLRGCDDGVCPTCEQDVDIKKHAALAEDSQDRLEKTLTALRIHRLTEQLEAIELTTVDTDRIETLQKEATKVKDSIRKLHNALEREEERLELIQDLFKLKKPKAVKANVKHTLTELTDMMTQHSELKAATRTKKQLEDQHGDMIAIDGLEERYAELKKKGAKLERKYIAAQEVVTLYNSKAGEFKALRRDQKANTTKLKELKPIIGQRDLLRNMEKAYSSKGLKVGAANMILAQIETNLNRYSNLIFAEPFKFKIYAESDGVHCEVDRGNGKVSDIRWLSGAEADCFRLLWMWVMLVMAEADRRTNFVVLDEPDAHMDDTTRALFIERYLPALRSVVPNVYLITPKDAHVYSDCVYMTVVKHKGVSTLVEDGKDDSSGLRVQPTGHDSPSVKSNKKSKKKRSSNRSKVPD